MIETLECIFGLSTKRNLVFVLQLFIQIVGQYLFSLEKNQTDYLEVRRVSKVICSFCLKLEKEIRQ